MRQTSSDEGRQDHGLATTSLLVVALLLLQLGPLEQLRPLLGDALRPVFGYFLAAWAPSVLLSALLALAWSVGFARLGWGEPASASLATFAALGCFIGITGAFASIGGEVPLVTARAMLGAATALVVAGALRARQHLSERPVWSGRVWATGWTLTIACIVSVYVLRWGEWLGSVLDRALPPVLLARAPWSPIAFVVAITLVALFAVHYIAVRYLGAPRSSWAGVLLGIGPYLTAITFELGIALAIGVFGGLRDGGVTWVDWLQLVGVLLAAFLAAGAIVGVSMAGTRAAMR